MRCDIVKGIGKRRRNPRVATRPGACQWARGAGFVCAGDINVADDDTRRIAYGDAVQVGRIRCVSKKVGMRCFNRRTGQGFELSRERANRF